MTGTGQPRLYLIVPPETGRACSPDQLQRVLDAAEISCVRLALSTTDEDRITRTVDPVRDICHARDIPAVIDDHMLLARRLGLDGVHLTGGARFVRKARRELGPEAIVGASCAASRHEGMNAGESGADYICFGPTGTAMLGDGGQATRDLFQWWSEMIEVPVVAEGALDEEIISSLSPVTDFFAIGEEIWTAPDPAVRLERLASAMRTAP